MRTILSRSALLLIAAFMGMFLVMPIKASAQGISVQQRGLFKDGILYFNYDDDVCQADAAGNFTQVPGDNPKTAFLFFLSKGLTPQDSAAIVGNMQGEAGAAMDPKVHQGGGGVGRGIVQWSENGRWQTLLKWAAANGNKDPWSLQTQLEFAWKELHDDNYQNALKMTIAATDLTEKVRIIMDEYEHAGARTLEKRLNFAKQLLTSNGVTLPAPAADPNAAPGAAPAGGCQALNNGLATVVDGFAFPIIATKTQLKTNQGAQWCTGKQTNCHHDYNAADIHMPTGAQVVAAKPGTVTSVHRGTGRSANNVTIKGANGDNFIYFYQHLGTGTIPVNEGQPVVAGQPIGKVGTSVDANGTNPHLHFDMLPSPPYNGRVNCSGGECSGYPFVDVQAILYKVFQSLPN